MKKKYLFVVPSLSKGGAERVVSILASELVKRNRNAVIVTHFRTEKEYPINNDVEVVCLSNLNETEYREKMSAIYLIKLARKLRKEIVRQNPDYILPFLWTTCVRTDFALMGLSLKERVIQTVRNNPTVFPKNSVMKKYRQICPVIYKQADTFHIFVSRQLLRRTAAFPFLNLISPESRSRNLPHTAL